ncbi:MAG: ACT domain-containing protein, partial [Oscillospiraceae bacterium]
MRARVNSVDDLYAAIGYGGVALSKVIQRIKDMQARTLKEQNIVLPTSEENIEQSNKRSRQKGVIIEGIDNVAVKFAQCCNPLPGDPIIGFVTRGFGVSIHKQDCINIINNMDSDENRDRWIKASWAGVDDSTYRATIDIIAEQKSTVIAEITTAIAQNRVPMHEMNMHRLKNGNTNLLITIEVAGVEQLANIISKIQKIPGVVSADRTGKQ